MGSSADGMRFSASFLLHLDVECELQDWITIEISLYNSVVQEDYKAK